MRKIGIGHRLQIEEPYILAANRVWMAKGKGAFKVLLRIFRSASPNQRTAYRRSPTKRWWNLLSIRRTTQVEVPFQVERSFRHEIPPELEQLTGVGFGS